MDLHALLRASRERKASDLHLRPGAAPRIRIDGELLALPGFPVITNAEMLSLASGMMNDWQQKKFADTREIDMAYGAPKLGRFRVNVFHQRGNVAMALRVLPGVPRLEDLNLPPVVEQICEERRGLVLVTGTTGSGKSTTLAAMIDRINSTRSDHIITIEDPIEFFHEDKQGFVNQREVEVDTASFGKALRSALRQDPDVILVGEMRDLETMQTALEAAETGHVVYSTLHTLDATETIQRIITAFPSAQQDQIRRLLAATLKAVVSQRLVRKLDGAGRVPAAEIMVSTEYIRDCIFNPEKTHLIRQAIVSGATPYGMQSFDQSLYDLYLRGLITIEEAFARATNAGEFRLRVAGIRSASQATREEMEQAAQVERFRDN